MIIPGKWDQDWIEESAREIPVVDKVDVLVAGGGPAGVGAALAAARTGVKTTVIERYGFLGGIWTAGMLNPILDHANKGGIVEEVVNRLRAAGKTFKMENRKEPFDNEYMKYLLDVMFQEAGVRIRLHRFITDVISDEDRVVGVVTESKSGRQAIMARTVIDCTGDGDVSALAGVPYEKGRPEDGVMQPMSMYFLMSNLNWQQSATYEIYEMLKDVVDSGHDYRIPYNKPSIFNLPQQGLASMLLTHMYGYDGTDADDLTTAEIEGRQQVHDAVNTLRRIPQFRDVELVSSAVQVGVRETRHIAGRYQLQEEDLVAGRSFDDGICWVNFSIDIHGPLPPKDGEPIAIQGRKVPPYQIPFRSLVPMNRENLLMAGRCISGTSRAHASYRVTGDCVAMGQAAGTAAALAIGKGVSPSKIDAVDLTNKLKADGVRI